MSEDLLRIARAAARGFPGVLGEPVPHMLRENAVYKLETDRGLHALRLHRPGYHSDQALLCELSWTEMLAERGLRVPRPMRSVIGAYLLDGPRRASLLSWQSGQALGKAGVPLDLGGGERRRAIFRSIGRNMARLHLYSDEWQRPADFSRPAWDRDGLVGETPFWGRFWDAAYLSDADRQLFVNVRDQAREVLDSTKADIGIIHADLVRENILLHGDEICFIDFDDSGTGYRAFDLATCLRANLEEPDFAALQSALLAGYAEIRPVPDLGLLPLMLALRALTYIGWSAARIDEPGMQEQVPRYLRLAKGLIADWQSAERARV